MRAVDELYGPVAYDPRWLILAVAAVGLVAVYYAAVLWWCRDRPDRPPPSRTPQTRRRACLRRIDEVERAVAAGEITAREGHQRLSLAVRAFVEETTRAPVRTMTLADLRSDGPPALAELVAVLYPPEFGADDDLPRAVFTPVVQEARRVVATWT